MDQVQDKIEKATGEQGGQGAGLQDAAVKGLEDVKAQVAEGLAAGGDAAAKGLESVKAQAENLVGSGGGGGAGKPGENADELKATATAYAKGEGGIDEVKKAATDTATSVTEGLTK